MQRKATLKGAMIAGAVATLFSAGQALAASSATDSGVKCAGANSCKGKGACSGASNSCKGENGCKGQGWTAMKNEKACTKKGGHIVADADKAAPKTDAPAPADKPAAGAK